jgi:glutamate dehydrogenase
MQTAYLKQHAQHIKDILRALPKSGGETLQEFTRQFYARIMNPDLERVDAVLAASVAASAYEFVQKRERDKPKIRVIQPQKRKHGYDLSSVVVELLNDDMPFLVDSLSAELTRHGFTIRETYHPIFQVQRDPKGNFKSLGSLQEKGSAFKPESFIHFEISAMPEGMTEEQLENDLLWIIQHVRAAVQDWQQIVVKVEQTIADVQHAPYTYDKEMAREVKDFLYWIIERNFVFLGYAEYKLSNSKNGDTLTCPDDSRLGVLKISDDLMAADSGTLPPEAGHFLRSQQLIEITKSSRRSAVHRPVPMDTISIKRFDDKGKIIGEVRFVGLFTSNVYYQSGVEIPLVRKKIEHVLERSNFDPVSHDGKSLKAILEFLPRDEIFQMTEDDLFGISIGILMLESKPIVRMFVRKDASERFVSVMVFVPRERFSTDLRRQIQALVEKAYSGHSSTFSTLITEEAPLARLHLIVKTSPGDVPNVNLAKIEAEIAKRAYLWSDQLMEALTTKLGEQRAQKYLRKYANAFPQSYINRYDATGCVYDIEKIEEAQEKNSLVLDLYNNKAEDLAFLHLKIYNPLYEIALSDILPLLENAGFRVIEEHPFKIQLSDTDKPVRIRDFKLQMAEKSPFNLDQVKVKIQDALLMVWQRELENDKFNALILRAGLDARQVTMLRACAKYLKQIVFTYSQAAIEQALCAHPQITRLLVELFEVRFSPAEKDRDHKQTAIRKEIEEQLGAVSNAVEDRILRRTMELMGAMLRTNYYQKDAQGKTKPVLSFKFDSANVPELPLPRPFAEIFVYGMRVEGIHLRGGKVARGGLRWSDRHEDFRTEVLGLMKAQMVKNSVIVPVGSKGGFVLKQAPATNNRDAFMAEGVECYKMYLSGLLDITDNIIKGKIVPPKQVVRHDGDDPYLVVAADKGTATFSDIANSVSATYGFWLGDAFASGGSVGYDHKKMGITARGGWVSVTRHFQEMGVDIGTQEFTTAGIGDMAGDVFGNGMLLSKNIRLVAAFNHMHIFIDPNPNAAKSFAERHRLFELPRSTWKDYDTNLISKGGGIFERSAKIIELSKEAQTALGVSKSEFTPDELMRAILLAPVDLLWNGGIGTYVKAEEESNEQVGDRANNAVRVNGRELRCKIVGEGGNLGFTQKGRIEYARAGGRINTDAIDNSAGVDCSDHEVNIKIAFSSEVASGNLTLAKRDKILAGMTDEVARLVLKDNILQTQAITIAEQQAYNLLESHTRLIHVLESRGILNREIEFLPSDRQLAELKAAKRGLTRPEIAVLLAYSKMALYKDMLESSLPDEEYFISDLKRYFPIPMQKDFAKAIEKHPLRREIIATVMTNSVVNRGSITFCFDIAEDLGASVRDIAAAYATVRDAFGLRHIWNGIEQNSATIDVATQTEMYAMTTQFLERVSTWLLHHLPMPLDIDTVSKEILPEVAEIDKNKASLHSEMTRKEAETVAARLIAKSVPKKLADAVTALGIMSAAPDIISVAHKNDLPVKDVGKAYFELGSKLGLSWLRQCAEQMAINSHWDRLAIKAIIADLFDEQRRLTDSVIAHSGGLTAWLEANKGDVESLERFMEGIKTGEAPDLPRLMVTLRQIRALGVA